MVYTAFAARKRVYVTPVAGQHLGTPGTGGRACCHPGGQDMRLPSHSPALFILVTQYPAKPSLRVAERMQ